MDRIKENQQLRVTYRPVAALIPYANNPRTHSDDQIKQIANSIKEFGWTNPVLVDGAHGIIAGHGRVMAARSLGLGEVPTIELSGMSEVQRRAYITADNQLAMNAGWDRDLLRLELGDLRELDFDLSLIGFPELELADIFADRTNGLTDPPIAPADTRRSTGEARWPARACRRLRRRLGLYCHRPHAGNRTPPTGLNGAAALKRSSRPIR
jgi:ParB-like chromosome segregation protein Spo0J